MVIITLELQIISTLVVTHILDQIITHLEMVIITAIWRFYAGGSGDIGISGYDSGGNWKFQLYGTSGAYGFLNANWSSWDIKKNVNGQMELRVSGSNYTVWHAGNLPSYDVSANANTIVRRDGSGHIQANYFYNSSGDSGSGIPSRFYTSGDNYD